MQEIKYNFTVIATILPHTIIILKMTIKRTLIPSHFPHHKPYRSIHATNERVWKPALFLLLILFLQSRKHNRATGHPQNRRNTPTTRLCRRQGKRMDVEENRARATQQPWLMSLPPFFLPQIYVYRYARVNARSTTLHCTVRVQKRLRRRKIGGPVSTLLGRVYTYIYTQEEERFPSRYFAFFPSPRDLSPRVVYISIRGRSIYARARGKRSKWRKKRERGRYTRYRKNTEIRQRERERESGAF